MARHSGQPGTGPQLLIITFTVLVVFTVFMVTGLLAALVMVTGLIAALVMVTGLLAALVLFVPLAARINAVTNVPALAFLVRKDEY